MTRVMQSALYLPYGAFELKAAYQRNMLVGMATPLVLIGLVFTAVTLWPARADLVPIAPSGSIPDTVTITIDLLRQRTIIPETPTPGPTQTRPAIEQGSIPVAVPDNDLPIEDAVLPSQDELRRMLGPGLDPGDGGELPAILPVPDLIPPPDSFVPLEIKPEMIFEAKPEYPRLNRIAGLSGAVWVTALVDKDGSVKEARVARSSGNQAFDEAAVAAAHKCKFSPGIQNGTPVYCWVTYKVDFRLSE